MCHQHIVTTPADDDAESLEPDAFADPQFVDAVTQVVVGTRWTRRVISSADEASHGVGRVAKRPHFLIPFPRCDENATSPQNSNVIEFDSRTLVEGVSPPFGGLRNRSS